MHAKKQCLLHRFLFACFWSLFWYSDAAKQRQEALDSVEGAGEEAQRRIDALERQLRDSNASLAEESESFAQRLSALQSEVDV